jgi:hypothetical protein
MKWARRTVTAHSADDPLGRNRGNCPPGDAKQSKFQIVVPAIKREKLMIEKIGLAGLLFLWLNALAVSFFVPFLCGHLLSQNLWIGILAGTLASAAVGARAVYRIRGSLRQWKERHHRLAAGDVTAGGWPRRS